MNITIERDAFLGAIQRVIGSVDRKGTVAALQHVAVAASGNSMRLTATNMDMQATTSCPCAIQGEAVFTLPGQHILDILNNWPAGGSVNITRTDADPRVFVKCGRSQFKLPTEDPRAIPFMASPEGPGALIVADALGSILSASAYAVSKNAVQYQMCGVYLTMDGNTLRAVGTDSHRMGMGECEARGQTGAAIITAGMFSEMMRLAVGSDLAELILTDSQAQLTVGDTVLVGKVVGLEYVVYQRFIEASRTHTLTVDREALQLAVKRALIMATDKKRSIRLTMTPDALQVEARSAEAAGGGEADNEIEALWDGEDRALNVNGEYLTAAIDQMKGATIAIKFGDRKGPFAMQEDGVSAFVMPQHG